MSTTEYPFDHRAFLQQRADERAAAEAERQQSIDTARRIFWGN